MIEIKLILSQHLRDMVAFQMLNVSAPLPPRIVQRRSFVPSQNEEKVKFRDGILGNESDVSRLAVV